MSTRWNPETRRLFLTAIARHGNISEAARETGISRSAINKRLFDDAGLREDLDDARDEALDRLRREAWRRAVEGDAQPLLSRGQPIHDDFGQPVLVRHYSDRLLLYLIKRLGKDNRCGIAD